MGVELAGSTLPGTREDEPVAQSQETSPVRATRRSPAGGMVAMNDVVVPTRAPLRPTRRRAGWCFRTLLPVTSLTLGVACAERQPSVTAGVVDDLGRSVVLDAPARRIVSLSPATTELLFAIGAGDRVVARTRWGDYPPAVLDLPSVGDGLNPNVEVIAAHRPDLVVFYASLSNAQAVDRLKTLAIPSVHVRMDRLASVPHAARLLGSLTGTGHRADSLARAFEAKLDSARHAGIARRGPRTVILTWDNPPIVIGAASYLSELVELAGGTNVFGDVDKPSVTVTIEAIAQRDPDVVLFIGDETVPQWAARPEWRVVDAVRQRRFARVKGTEFERPTFRALGALRELVAVLHEASR